MEFFFSQFNDNSIKILLLIAISAGITATVHFLLFRSIKIFSKSEKTKQASHSIKKMKWPSFLFMLIITTSIFYTFLNLNIIMHRYMTKGLVIALIVSLSWFAINGVKLLKFFILLKYDINREDNLQARKVDTQLRVFERIIITLIIIVTIASILMTFNEIKKIGINLLASAGIAGIIIGLAAQKSISNIIAGIQIALTQPIRIDDVLIVENEWGKVEEINLTYVVLKIWDQRRLIIPLSHFIDKPFQNWTRSTAELLGTVFLYVDYTVDVDAMRKELDAILASTNLWDKRVGIIQVTDTTDKTMEIRILVSAKDSPTAFDLRVLIREKMIAFLQKNYPDALPKIRISQSDK